MNKTIITAALAALLSLGATAGIRSTEDFRRKAAEEVPFKWAPKHEENKWKLMSTRPGNAAKAFATVTEADVSWSGADGYSYLEMPDGSIWFTSTTITKEVLTQSEYYTDYAYTGIEVTIYDSNFNKAGYINAPINVPEGYAYCSSLDIGATVTRNFFNSDSNFEVMVMYNFRPENDYGAVPFTEVFSLQGADTPAQSVMTVPGYYVSAVNASTSSWSEDYYMTFFAGENYTDDEILYTFDIYTKATYSNPLASVLKSFTVDMVYVMADGENESLPVLLNAHDGTVYVAVSRYEKTFFANPFNPFDDTLSPDNKYIIDLYKSTQGWGTKELNLASTTEIPCETPAEPYMMRSYCLGRFSYTDDVSFDFGTGDEPAYIISVTDADMRDNSESFFAIYSVDAQVMETFGLNTDALLLLSDVDGYPTQYCFVQPGPDGNYQFNMVNYPQLDIAATLPIAVESDGDLYGLSFTLDRVAGNGSYLYAVASNTGRETETGETYHPVLWFDRNGILTGVDRIMGGKDVVMMSPYIAANGLSPYVFNTDVKHEYMAFVLRTPDLGTTAGVYNLIVVNEDGEDNLCYVFPDDATSITASLVNMSDQPAIWISYRIAGADEYYSDFIKLPLNKMEGDGTVDNPYLLYTAGDFALIKHNLKAHYRLAADIDFDGTAIEPVKGSFTGSIDGAGHTMRNFTVSGAPLFDIIGELDAPASSVKNLTLSHVTLTDAPAVLATSVYNTLLENVYVYDLDARISGGTEFGGLVNGARHGSSLTGCAVMGSINAPGSDAVGGLVKVLFNARIDSSVFEGEITGQSNVGGIVSEIQDAAASITDCHVKASLTAMHTIGGVAAVSGRGVISRCLVEGAIDATGAGRSYSYYAGGWVEEINVGGIVGSLNRPVADYETGQVNVGEPVTKNVVALTSITLPAGDNLLATAHRIVGRSSINDDPAILDETFNPATGDWEVTWGDRLAEVGIIDNYAAESLPVIDPAAEPGADSLEGKSIAESAMDTEFFESLGFKFNGYSATEPWVFNSALPTLYFESEVGAAIYFDPAAVSVAEGESTYVLLVLEKVDFESLTIESSDESGCYLNPVEIDDDGNIVCELTCLRTGSYTITATNGFVTATLAVTGTSGIDSVTAPAATTISYDGNTLTAPGASISVYTVTGTTVARGNGIVTVGHLTPGIYIATAGTGNSTSTLKFIVR